MSDRDGPEPTERRFNDDIGAFVFECPECGDFAPIVGMAVGGPGDGRPIDEAHPVLGCGSIVRIAAVERGPDVQVDVPGDRPGTGIDIE